MGRPSVCDCQKRFIRKNTKSTDSQAKYRLKATQSRSASDSHTFFTTGGKNPN